MQVANTPRQQQETSAPQTSVYTCGSCNMVYFEYKLLLEHLYWRHGTESRRCQECGLRRWTYAAHVCHILPIFIEPVDDDYSCYCYCKKEVAGVPMIGCDNPLCQAEWYHFPCVGIVSPPEGDWICPECTQAILNKQKNTILKSNRTPDENQNVPK